MPASGLVMAGIVMLSCTGQSEFRGMNYSQYERRWIPFGPTHNSDRRNIVFNSDNLTWCTGTKPCGEKARRVTAQTPDGYWVLEEHPADSKGGYWQKAISKDGKRYENLSRTDNAEERHELIAKGTCTQRPVAIPAERPSTPPLRPAAMADRWTGTRWSGFPDCSQNLITLQAGGNLQVSNGAKGNWRGGRNTLLVNIGANWSALMEPNGEFSIADSKNSGAGRSWEQCDVAGLRPILPLRWIEGQRWSGYSTCDLIMTFERGGRLALSNGGSGRWSLRSSRLVLELGDSKQLTLVRAADRLIEEGSNAGFTRCR